MNAKQISAIIESKNQRLEQAALDRASDIITSIGNQHSIISAATERIEVLRKELRALSHEPINPTNILGEQ